MEKERVGVRIPQKMNEALRVLAESKGISKNALITLILWNWKKSLNRKELLKIIPNEELTEMEIEMYAEVKGATK